MRVGPHWRGRGTVPQETGGTGYGGRAVAPKSEGCRTLTPFVACLCLVAAAGCGSSLSTTTPAVSAGSASDASANSHSSTSTSNGTPRTSPSPTATSTGVGTAAAAVEQAPPRSQKPSPAAMPEPLVMRLWVDGKSAPINTNLKFTRAVGQHMAVKVRWTDGEGANMSGGQCGFSHLCGDHMSSPSAQCSSDPSSGGADDQTVFTEPGTYHYDYAVATIGCRSGDESGHVSIDITVPGPPSSPTPSSSVSTEAPTTP